MPKIIVIGTLCISFLLCSGQTRVSDVGMWLSLAVQKDVSSKQWISIMGRIRQYENFSRMNSWYMDAGYGYKLHRNFKFSLHYALNPSLTSRLYYRNLHQYYLRLDGRHFINKYFTFYSRIILQHTTHRFFTDIQDNGFKPYYRTDFRVRIGGAYNLDARSRIYLHDECMYTLSAIPIELRRNRVYAGYEKSISKMVEVKIYFVVQSNFHKRNNFNYDYFILGCDWTFKWN